MISTQTKADDTERRELRMLYEESLEELSGLDDMVLTHLVAEGTLKNIQDDFSKRMTQLSSSECPILVAGTHQAI